MAYNQDILVKLHVSKFWKVYRDTSGFDCGAYIVDRPGFIFHDIWSNDDCNTSSFYREIKAVVLASRGYGHF